MTISNHPDAEVAWSPAAVSEIAPTCDLAVVPTGTGDEYRVKSSNRVVLFMGQGIPVIAGDIPSYREVVRHGENGLLAHDAEGYRAAFRLLRQSETRRSLAGRAYHECVTHFSVETIAGRWHETLLNIAAGSAAPPPLSPQARRRLAAQLRAHGELRSAVGQARRGSEDVAWREYKAVFRLAMTHPAALPLGDLVRERRIATAAIRRNATRVPLIGPVVRLAGGGS